MVLTSKWGRIQQEPLFGTLGTYSLLLLLHYIPSHTLANYPLPIAQWASPLDGGFSRKNIFCQKIFDNFFSFQATEMVLTSKWGRIQQEIQI